MLPRTYETQVCSIARSLEAIGDRWTMLVVRDAFLGVRRFEEFQDRLGVARNILSDRLGRLVDDGILEKRPYQERPQRFEYRLTEKGRDLFPVMISLMKWGDAYALDPGGPPMLVALGEVDLLLRGEQGVPGHLAEVEGSRAEILGRPSQAIVMLQLGLGGRGDLCLGRRGLELKVDIVVQIDSHLVPPAALTPLLSPWGGPRKSRSTGYSSGRRGVRPI